ncbi:MAG: glycerol-3-phosphate 1-O-acyltransferase PlsY [Ignavibacteriota bacterium]
METFLFAIIGYLLGSIPFAYLIVRTYHRVDLRSEGSKNIGARNAFEVTANKKLGFSVLILDLLKGIIPLILLSELGFCAETPLVAAMIVLGHCFPVWLRFHGGRGLATGAGIALLISPDSLLCWLLIYFLMGIVRKQVHIQSLVATLATLIFAVTAYSSPLFFKFRFICQGDKYLFQVSIIAILCIILVKHIEPVYRLITKPNP